jgi:NAD-dependent deacetylase
MHSLGREDRLFVLTGAGVSAESGLPTFRGAGGIWRGYPAQQVATPEAFHADPLLVWQFYSMRRGKHQEVKPNPAHFALAELERELGDRFFLCTQNVDSLHEQAGSQRVLHMHGRLTMTRCSREECSLTPFEDSGGYESEAELPKCPRCGALLRPHVCWFGEVPYEMDRIFAELERSTVLMTVGSSGVVEPAASFVRLARRNGARTIYIGPEQPANGVHFDEVVLERAGEALPEMARIMVESPR